MENASDALVMAGSVLLSLIIIGALVFMYRDLSSGQKADEENKKMQQVTEFNRTFTSFEKKLYGSELLSLVNKAIDYDRKIKDEQSGYKQMKIAITVTRNAGTFTSAGTYVVNDEDNAFKTKLDEIETIKIKYNGDKYLEKLSAMLSGGTTGEEEFKRVLTEELKININTTAALNKAKSDIQLFTDYIDFKRKKFSHVETFYDMNVDGNGNGRVIQMSFKEI